MAGEQLDLAGICPHCHQTPATPGIPHGNVCPRWKCSRCNALFALFPDPLSKQYGRDTALCAACLRDSGPKPDHLRAIRVTPDPGAGLETPLPSPGGQPLRP